MSISQIASITKSLLVNKKLTRKQAFLLCEKISHNDCIEHECINFDAVDPLKRAFPEFKWRVAQDRSGWRALCFVTIMTDDPREHYTGDDEPPEQKEIYCIHCNKYHKRGVPPKGKP